MGAIGGKITSQRTENNRKFQIDKNNLQKDELGSSSVAECLLRLCEAEGSVHNTTTSENTEFPSHVLSLPPANSELEMAV